MLIQNKTVILDKTIIHTRQYDLTIIADEFISDHSIIRNFPDGETAEAKEIGRSGGHILIKTKKARGSLQLILNGENGGMFPGRKYPKEKKRISQAEMVQMDIMLFIKTPAIHFIILWVADHTFLSRNADSYVELFPLKAKMEKMVVKVFQVIMENAEATLVLFIYRLLICQAFI